MSIFVRFKQLYQEEQFNPSFFALVINPFYFARSKLRDVMVEFAPKMSGRLLDVGCGSQPYRRYFLNNNYVGLDIDTVDNRKAAVADYFYDGSIFPFEDDSFDSVICNQVFEHIFNPKDFLAEIRRVLKPEGLIILTVPFVWDEHEQPYDFARYTSFGLKHIFKEQSLDLIEHRKLGADISVLFQLLNVYIFKVGRKLPKWWFFLLTITIMAAVNIFGLVLCKILPKNEDLFLDHVILAKNSK